MTELSDFHAKNVSFDPKANACLAPLLDRIPEMGTLHVAILQPPYLDLIVRGIKTVESRFNTKRAAPFGKVAVGDLVLMKHSGQPITNYFFAEWACSIDLDQETLESVRAQYAPGICAQNEEDFWQARQASRYCTLVGVGERGNLEPLPVFKKDQRGWITFDRQATALF